MDDMTPEQAAILDLLRRVEDLERTVQHLTLLVVKQEAPQVAVTQIAPQVLVTRRLTANPDRGRIAGL